jgi:hypothetical protein
MSGRVGAYLQRLCKGEVLLWSVRRSLRFGMNEGYVTKVLFITQAVDR